MPAMGTRAPDFRLSASSGQEVVLSEIVKARVAVLYFYPQDRTPICTREACAFRNRYEAIAAAGGTVVGISRDAISSHLAFAARWKLPFLLASDSTGEVHRSYGIGRRAGLFRARGTFIVDRTQVIRAVWSPFLWMDRHVDDVVAKVHALNE